GSHLRPIEVLRMAITPSTVILDKGLDLVSPKVSAEPGSLIDCLNYETVDYVGARRIDGLVRYDGRVSPSAEVWFEIGFDTDPTPAAGDLIFVEGDSSPFGFVVDKRVDNDIHYLLYVRINVDLEPTVGENVAVFGDDAFTEVSVAPRD